MIDKTIVNGKIIEPESCGATGPYEVECQLPKGHEGYHEAGLNSELYEWEDEDKHTHEPKWDTLQQADGAPGIVDIWCECGISGSIRIDPNFIQWEP